MIEQKGGGEVGREEVKKILEGLYTEASDKFPKMYCRDNGLIKRQYYIRKKVFELFPTVFKQKPGILVVLEWLVHFEIYTPKSRKASLSQH
ncbi:hypothetical protein KKF61_00915 [Patescibacteria group bacterium]|nr:hypothetical protein [Patescibacteria group bacterium]MBU0963516.1 hypothetical protein [Patescibacteria group bacterium]